MGPPWGTWGPYLGIPSVEYFPNVFFWASWTPWASPYLQMQWRPPKNLKNFQWAVIKPTEKTLGQWPDLIATGSRRSKHVLAARPPASSLTPTATPPSKGSPISGTTPEAKGDSNNAESLSLTLPDTPEDSILQSEQGSSGMAAFAFSWTVVKERMNPALCEEWNILVGINRHSRSAANSKMPYHIRGHWSSMHSA